MTCALITGITGQDGSYLAELLLKKGYEVHGVVRRCSNFNTQRIDHLYQGHHGATFHLHYGDLLDPLSMVTLFQTVKPDEVYNLASQSHVGTSFKQPVYTVQAGALGAMHVLEAFRQYVENTRSGARFYQASSSEMFGNATPPQGEMTPFQPRSPYACAKVFAYYQTINYRQAYGLWAVNGILFNNESPRRGETFVSRKITRAATRIKLGLQDELRLGNLHAMRDWGYAPEYMEAAWQMLQHKEPDDFVIATGVSHSVRDFLEAAFSRLDLNWKDHVHVDEAYMRPSDVAYLEGDSGKAMRRLGWTPSTSFAQLVDMMVESDLKQAEGEALLKEKSYV